MEYNESVWTGYIYVPVHVSVINIWNVNAG